MKKLKCEKCKSEFWSEDIWGMRKIDWELSSFCKECRKRRKKQDLTKTGQNDIIYVERGKRRKKIRT